MLVGYMRVSSDSDRQTTDLQRDALLSAGVDSRHLTNLAAGDTSVGSTPGSGASHRLISTLLWNPQLAISRKIGEDHWRMVHGMLSAHQNRRRHGTPSGPASGSRYRLAAGGAGVHVLAG